MIKVRGPGFDCFSTHIGRTGRQFGLRTSGTIVPFDTYIYRNVPTPAPELWWHAHGSARVLMAGERAF